MIQDESYIRRTESSRDIATGRVAKSLFISAECGWDPELQELLADAANGGIRARTLGRDRLD